MENNGEMSITQALNHVQSWLNAGEYDKVIQGCQEILQIEPGNTRALALMRKAEEMRHASVMKEETPMPKPEPAPAEPAKDPLASLQVEDEPEITLPEIENESYEKKKLFMAMLIPAVLVVLLGGGAIWWVSNREREAIIEDNLTDGGEEDEADLNYLDRNDERVKDMTMMVEAIEAYKLENGAYPSLSQIESVFDEVPSDPRQGKIDKAGKAYGYMYAVYSGIGGENSVYVLSALFEDSKGFGTPWAQGAPIKNYPDYRDYEADHVTFIGGDEDEVEEPGKGLEDEEESDEAVEDRETPSDGPKVNPDNN